VVDKQLSISSDTLGVKNILQKHVKGITVFWFAAFPGDTVQFCLGLCMFSFKADASS
jgi:hypothetical protein